MIFRGIAGALALALIFFGYRFFRYGKTTSSAPIGAGGLVTVSSSPAPTGTTTPTGDPNKTDFLAATSYNIEQLGSCNDNTAFVRVNGVTRTVQAWFDWINAYYAATVAAHPTWQGTGITQIIRLQPDNSLCWYSSPWVASATNMGINTPLCEGIRKFFQDYLNYRTLPFTLMRPSTSYA